MSRALGRYELLRPLARGGMAEVFLARRRAAGVEKFLVVKRMRPERAGDARFLDLFVREARLSMSLAHQNIVPVFDFGRIDDQVFIAMERIEGKDLGSSLAKTRPDRIPPLLAAFIAAECCQALDYAHLRKGPDGAALGIVHRDVTPRNVLLSWSGEVKLTDFGIAALAGDDPSKVIGTAAYMAPEQARGETVDPRADVYAVGMILREALTGMRPRPGDEREVTLAAARRGELIPWPDGFDSPLVAIVNRATALDRDQRYADARAMLEELDGFIVGERAAKKTDAPARALAAWLGEVWREEREDAPIDDTLDVGSHLVSFLDDGALDVIGTGTERSMAGTAEDSPAPITTPTTSPAPAPTTTLITSPPPPQQKTLTLTPTPRRRIIAFAVVAVIAAIGGFIVRSGSSPSPSPVVVPKTDPVVVPKTDPMTPPKIDPVTPPKIDPVTPPKTDPVTPPKHNEPTHHLLPTHLDRRSTIQSRRRPRCTSCRSARRRGRSSRSTMSPGPTRRRSAYRYRRVLTCFTSRIRSSARATCRSPCPMPTRSRWWKTCDASVPVELDGLCGFRQHHQTVGSDRPDLRQRTRVARDHASAARERQPRHAPVKDREQPVAKPDDEVDVHDPPHQPRE